MDVKLGITGLAQLLLLCLVSLPGLCAERTSRHEFRTWIDFRDEGIVKQSLDYSCGPAAIATLLNYYFRMPTTEQDVLDRLEDHSKAWQLPHDWRQTGASMAALAKVAGHAGLEAVGVAVDLNTLSRLRMPAIAYLEHRGVPHFSVIRGVGRSGAIQLADPSWGNQRLSQLEFQALWPVDERNKGKLLLLRPDSRGETTLNHDYFSVSSRSPILRNSN